MDQLAYRELDTVGIVVCTVSDHVMSHDPEGAERQVDSVFVADSEGCLMVVRIWDGIKVNANSLMCTPAEGACACAPVCVRLCKWEHSFGYGNCLNSMKLMMSLPL